MTARLTPPTQRAPSAAMLRSIERMAQHGTEAHWKRMPADFAARAKARTAWIGDAFLTSLAGSDSLRMNRVIGFGHRERVRERLLDAIIAFYREGRVRRFSLLMSPGPHAQRIESWLLARGFRRTRGHALLVRDARRPVPHGLTAQGLVVRRASSRDAAAIVDIHAQCFGLAPSRRRWSLAAVRARGLEHYLACAGTTPIAAGALWVEGGLAWLGGGATLTRWRRRGAHAALIAARLGRCARLGCRWAWVETAAPGRGMPQGSHRNLVRLGFADACLKPSFVLELR